MSTGRRRGLVRGLSPSIEAVLVVPVIVLLVGVMTAGFRLWQGRADIDQVAGAAARAASQARSTAEARHRISTVVTSNSLPCDNPVIASDLTGFAAPLGAAAQVTVTITCRVGLADLLVPGLPGSQQVSGSGSSALDPYRKRNP